ncbi:hypothetical protein K439DRAFT_1616701 [Ramaria rubella]|nr:hypothetical protein K439DRAFT_1616701 [Ramaria rubella]
MQPSAPLSSLSWSHSILCSNSASTCKTAHVQVMVGIGGMSESLWAYLACGSRMTGGGVLLRSTVTVDGGVEPHVAPGGVGGMGRHEMVTHGGGVRMCVRECMGAAQWLSVQPGTWGCVGARGRRGEVVWGTAADVWLRHCDVHGVIESSWGSPGLLLLLLLLS